MRCEEIMKRELEFVAQNDTVQAAAVRMRDENIGFLPVCDSNRKVLGTITDRDLAVRVLAAGKPLSTKVADVMSRDMVACRPEDDLQKAELLLEKHHKSRIICLDDSDHLIGVISLSDIAQHDEQRIGRTMRAVSEREAHPHH